MMLMHRYSGFHISNLNFLVQLMNSARPSDKLLRSTTSNQDTTLQNMKNLNNSWSTAITLLAPNYTPILSVELSKNWLLQPLPNPVSILLDTSSNFTKENSKEPSTLTQRTCRVTTSTTLLQASGTSVVSNLNSDNSDSRMLILTINVISVEDWCKSNLRIFLNNVWDFNLNKLTQKNWKISKSKLREIELFIKLVKVKHLISIFLMTRSFGKPNLWFAPSKDNSSSEIWALSITLESSLTPNVKFKFKKDQSLILEKLFTITSTKLFTTKDQVSKAVINSIFWDQIKNTKLIRTISHISGLDQFGSVLTKTLKIFKMKFMLIWMVRKLSIQLEDQWKEIFKSSLKPSQLTTAPSNMNQEKVGPSASEEKKSAHPTVLTFS